MNWIKQFLKQAGLLESYCNSNQQDAKRGSLLTSEQELLKRRFDLKKSPQQEKSTKKQGD
jgi:hypothetical protein